MSNYVINVGDMIVDSEQIHVVSKIENDRVCYYPLHADSSKGKCTSSIPLSNLSKADIRPILTKAEVKEFLKKIATEQPLEVPEFTNRNNNSNSLKEILYLNDPTKTARLLIYFLQHQTATTPLSRFDQSIYEQALTHLGEEIAVACDIDLDSAKKQILSAIKKSA